MPSILQSLQGGGEPWLSQCSWANTEELCSLTKVPSDIFWNALTQENEKESVHCWSHYQVITNCSNWALFFDIANRLTFLFVEKKKKVPCLSSYRYMYCFRVVPKTKCCCGSWCLDKQTAQRGWVICLPLWSKNEVKTATPKVNTWVVVFTLG